MKSNYDKLFSHLSRLPLPSTHFSQAAILDASAVNASIVSSVGGAKPYSELLDAAGAAATGAAKSTSVEKEAEVCANVHVSETMCVCACVSVLHECGSTSHIGCAGWMRRLGTA